MKTIGLIGGMSWQSTASYYQIINQQVNQRLGGLHSAKLCIVSVDFAQIEQLQQRGDWHSAAEVLIAAARNLQRAGADFFLIATNTMHIIAAEVAAAVTIPLLHIADTTAATLHQQQITTVGLLGTRFTMEQDFYRQRLATQGIDSIIPHMQQRQRVHDVIYHQLCKGRIEAQSRDDFLDIVADLRHRGAQGVILGCTEIALLVNKEHTDVRLFDTTGIHAHAAVDLALAARASAR